jgi:hypothetical protein
MIEKEKPDCVASILSALKKTSCWRLKLSGQYPDTRNAHASVMLAKLADEAPSLSDAYFDILKPHFNSNPARWREALSQSARQIGFLHNNASFPFFVRILIGLLSEPTA